MLRALVLMLVVGCSPRTDLPCRPGFARAADGHCYPPPRDPAPPSANDVLEALGPCVALKDGDEIDIAAGCIEGACAGDRFDEVDAALGGDADCALTSSEANWSCTWPQDVEGVFPVDPDEPEDGPLPEVRTEWIRARTDYVGATAEGLGITVSLRCFVDELDLPDYALFIDVVGTLLPVELYWEAYGVEIEDEERITGNGLPDGLVDELTLFGPS